MDIISVAATRIAAALEACSLEEYSDDRQQFMSRHAKTFVTAFDGII
jgi:hypothetical protein